MPRAQSVLLVLGFSLLIAGVLRGDDPTSSGMRAALLVANDISEARISQLKSEGTNSIVVVLDGNDRAARSRVQVAATHVQAADLHLYYWIEVARCPALADAHPEWMASLQGHNEWRRLFPEAPSAADGQVVKTYPWVPILSKETHQAQSERVRELLSDRPEPVGVFLNDLQGSPSACGCGSTLCRWTSDYGKKRTTTPLGDDAAATFVRSIQESLPNSTVIPVWVTECEEHDGAQDGMCAGVGCFKGICWKAYTAQLEPVAQQCSTLGVLLPYRQFQRDLPIYGQQPGSWIRHALESFASMPPQHDRPAIEAARLVPVLQGWDVDASQIAAQILVAQQAGVAGYVVAYSRIEQGWQPKLVEL